VGGSKGSMAEVPPIFWATDRVRPRAAIDATTLAAAKRPFAPLKSIGIIKICVCTVVRSHLTKTFGSTQ
jgi:hypothetical protein